jgi:hypothetical protein
VKGIPGAWHTGWYYTYEGMDGPVTETIEVQPAVTPSSSVQALEGFLEGIGIQNTGSSYGPMSVVRRKSFLGTVTDVVKGATGIHKRPQSSVSGDDRAGEAQRRHYPAGPGRTARRMSWHSRGLRAPGSASCMAFLLALGLFAFGPALTDTATGAPANSPAGSATEKVTCPSQKFTDFLAAFSERADLQRRYTLLPLQYGQASEPGGPIKWRKIKIIEEIPYFIAETQLLFRNSVQRSEKGLDVNIEPRPDPRLNEVVIFQKSQDGYDGYDGYSVRYYFSFQMDRCWYLYAIQTGA